MKHDGRGISLTVYEVLRTHRETRGTAATAAEGEYLSMLRAYPILNFAPSNARIGRLRRPADPSGADGRRNLFAALL